jgi:hypothetical protein
MHTINGFSQHRCCAPVNAGHSEPAVIYVPSERILREALTIFNLAVAYASIQCGRDRS